MRRKTLLIIFLFVFSLLVGNNEGKSYNEETEVVKRSMFPQDFIFGVGTAAYQIEGAYLEDGKGLSNWDVFTHVPGNIASGENGDIADEHYHRYMEDVEKLEFLGVDSYRFSIAWTRILPRGRFGKVNPSGVIFYNKIIDNLLLKGIKPFVTIHHNDIPQELEDRYGSWLSPQMQEDFLLYAKTCFEYFGDRVKKWVTINEPNIYAPLAYQHGLFPPKRCSLPFGNCSIGNSDVEPLIAAHNMLVAHAKAVKLYREKYQLLQGGTIGISLNAFHYEPYTNDESGYQAVERSYEFNVAWILDPLMYGDYPSLMHKYLGDVLPKFSKDEVDLVKGSLDFIGINHYTSFYAIDCFDSTNCNATDNRAIQGFVGKTAYNREGVPLGDEMDIFNFHVMPQGMEKVMDYISMKYPNTTIYITENGYCPPNYKVGTEMLDDVKRIKFHEDYLLALAKAMRKGAKVKGYFVWTLLDNYEWVQGYEVTFGLYYVDRKTMERTPKRSAEWYARFLSNGGKSNVNSF